MIAIYARQSADRPDSISVEQQIELCEYEARGEETRVYADKGYSGKNTDRPRFTRMMQDIREGQIRAVIVYKLDRISRSILDFSNMMEEFSRYRVQFISATEKFDTSSPVGNAMLNICIVFAQLERETIQKRVADAYSSRSRRSFYMGGPIPYGFRKVPAVISGVHTSMYEPVPEEAKAVRLIYERYSRPDTSYGDVIKELDRLGIKKRGKAWARPRIREILLNPIYVRADLDVYRFFIANGAEVEASPSEFSGENGCYSYRSRPSDKKSTASLEDIRIVPAPHKGIVEPGLWLKCREKCMARKQVIPTQKAKNSWLTGKIKCGECGYALTARNYSHDRRYLLCSHRLDTGACCGAGTLYTAETEQLVYGEMRKKLAQFTGLTRPAPVGQDIRRTTLELELAWADKEISALLEKVANSDEALFRYINERISVLDRRRTEIKEQLRELSRKSPTADRPVIRPTEWEELSFEDKRQVTDALIRVIYASGKKLIIQWRV